MKEALSSFDVTAVVKELQRYVDWNLDKVYQPTREHLILALKSRGEGKEFINFFVGKWLFRSTKTKEMPQQPTDFAMMLRKRVSNARLTGVRQQGFERIIVLTLEKDGKYELVLELFAEGNVVLVKDGIIIQPLISRTWKHRVVRARREFAFPPPIPDPSEMDQGAIMEMMKASDADIVRTLATRMNLGGRYSEEACARLGIDPHREAADVSVDESSAILDMIKTLMKEAKESEKGIIVKKGGVVEDVVPISMRTYDGGETSEFPSFSEAIEEYISMKPATKKEKVAEESKDSGKLKRKIAQQEAAVTSLQDESKDAQAAGDALYAIYGEVNAIIATAKRNVDASGDVGDMPGVVSFDRKSSILNVKIADATFRLDIKGSVESSAQRYYEDAKKAKRKLEGLLVVLVETRKEIEQQKKMMMKASDAEKTKHKPTKRFWFERYRWFISSEDAVVLGGKDAKSNDMLVKKHLDDGDRYAHADMHGAPSIVVKMKDGVGEETLREACEFAVATSKAWNAKIGSAAGYWVLPEQVSKTPQSGEYLAKGAFVIRGKRNYTNKIDIRLAIGEIVFENERKIMCGPISAVRAKCTRLVILRPGRIEKNRFAKVLADRFGVPIEEIQSILPPGDLDILESSGIDIQELTSRRANGES